MTTQGCQLEGREGGERERREWVYMSSPMRGCLLSPFSRGGEVIRESLSTQRQYSNLLGTCCREATTGNHRKLENVEQCAKFFLRERRNWLTVGHKRSSGSSSSRLKSLLRSASVRALDKRLLSALRKGSRGIRGKEVRRTESLRHSSNRLSSLLTRS